MRAIVRRIDHFDERLCAVPDLQHHRRIVWAILTLLLVITLSILITRIATIVLIHTGLSRESARFQARSAFTGAGFTTSESEKIVNHPVRRRVIGFLMLLGNAGIVTAVSSLILTFVNMNDQGSIPMRIGTLALGVAILWWFGSSSWVDRHLSRLVDRMLRKYTRLDVRDYASLMHLVGDHRLVEMYVEEDDWIAGRTLAQSQLRDEGLIVLGIQRADGSYLAAPKGHSTIHGGDTMIVYGRTAAIEELDQRRRNRRGDLSHEQAVRERQLRDEPEVEG